MGCDIHLYSEYRLGNSIWQPGDVWVQDKKWSDELEWRVPSHVRPYDHRNYDFFAWLAGVRNGTWGEEITPISPPKGLPNDCCERIKQESEKWGCDGHSHSWLMLKELTDAYKIAKEKEVWFRGAIDISEPSPALAGWLDKPEDQRGKPPVGYCAWGTNCTPCAWKEMLTDVIEDGYHKLTDYLWDVGFEFGVPNREENIRAVFWFDN